MLACYYVSMQVIPAVDLLGEEAVRLEKGEYDRVVNRMPVAEYVAALLATERPFLHVVDLDGARSGTVRFDVVRKVINAAGATPVQVSGGVRTVQSALDLIAAGASRVVMGTAAFGERAVLDDMVARLGDRLVVAVDVRDGNVAVAGWLNQTAISVDDALVRCRDAGVQRILGTAISRDGTMSGPDLELVSKFCASGLNVLAAGGIRDAKDLAALEQLGCEGAILGRALAETVLMGAASV
jgi:phosphoribosylformimino-5-aminoimidazole carboxamide ribotide isomerase